MTVGYSGDRRGFRLYEVLQKGQDLALADGRVARLECFTLGDLDHIISTERRASRSPWTLKNFRDSVEGAHFCIGAVLDGQWRAHMVISMAADEAELLILAVDPDVQRLGLASRMMRCVMSALQGVADQLFLEVRESNTRAINFYEQLGFNCLGERPNYYPAIGRRGRENALIYGAQISTDEDQE